MKNKMMLLALTLLALATPIFAQDQGGGAGGGSKTHLAAAYLAMGIA
jgi:hypothetical protein